MPAGPAAFVSLPHSCREGQGDAGWQPVRLWVWGSLLFPVCHHWRKTRQRSYALPLTPGYSVLQWKYGLEDHWAIAHPDNPRPESISQDERLAVLQKLS
jgi:hypothetical protein